MNLTKLAKLSAVSVLALILAGNASASIDWTFPNGQLTDIDSGGAANDTWNSTVSGVEATFSAWSNTGGSSQGGAGNEFELAHLWSYSGGLGISAEPWAGGDDQQESRNHAVGGYGCSGYNCTSGNYLEEFILVEFDELMALTELSLSWYSWDSDMTILAYTDTPASGDSRFTDGFQRSDMTSLNSDTGDTCCTNLGLTNAGWEVVANPNDVWDNPGHDVSFNTGADQVVSNYWLIGNRNKNLASGDHTKDFFKVNLIGGHKFVGDDGGTDGGVPVPGTALLLGLGLLMVRARTRAQRQ